MGCSLEKSVAEELVVGYAARTLDSSLQAEFEQHLETCRQCSDLAIQQRAVWTALEEWQPLAVSPDFDQKLAVRMRHSDAAQHWRLLSWSWRALLPLAAACAVLLFAFSLKDPDFSAAPSPSSLSKAEIEQQVEHALDDMDMLKQVGIDVAVERPGPSRI